LEKLAAKRHKKHKREFLFCVSCAFLRLFFLFPFVSLWLKTAGSGLSPVSTNAVKKFSPVLTEGNKRNNILVWKS
jgi:hypothetical protein